MANIKHYKQDNGTLCSLSHYDSIAEMEADCIDRPMTRSSNRQHASYLEFRTEGHSWYGVGSLREVKRCLKEGYMEGAKAVDQLYDSIAPRLPRAIDFRRQLVRSDQGDSLDIHAVNRGAIDKAWTTAKRRARLGTGLIRIAVDICANADVSASTLQWRGIAALALARAMTKAGYSVEIVAGLCTVGVMLNARRNDDTKAQTHVVVTVTVKPRYAAVDTATLAASVCLPGFFRHIGFLGLIRHSDDSAADASGSLGCAVRLETVLPVPEKIAQVIVPETVDDSSSAEKWVRDSVALLQGATLGKEQQR